MWADTMSYQKSSMQRHGSDVVFFAEKHRIKHFQQIKCSMYVCTDGRKPNCWDMNTQWISTV